MSHQWLKHKSLKETETCDINLGLTIDQKGWYNDDNDNEEDKEEDKLRWMEDKMTIWLFSIRFQDGGRLEYQEKRK